MYIILDFDSTFIQVESLDELAAIALEEKDSNTIEQVRKITRQGMDGDISFSQSLASRLALLSINKLHINILIEKLSTKVSASFKRNTSFLKRYADYIYVVSSGFEEYIIPIVTKYGINPQNVYANTFIYDDSNNVIAIDMQNPLSHDQGKVNVVRSLGLSGEIAVIGDGYTDYEIVKYGCASKFYAFTENVTRHNVVAVADVVLPDLEEFLYLNNLPANTRYAKSCPKVLLLENIHSQAKEILEQQGYCVESLKNSLSEEQLCEKIKDVSILGIRSKTMITEKILQHANALVAIGAFCIGTNQIDLASTSKMGICVFNAPYSNTRSVVELALGEIIMLARDLIAKNYNLHQGIWDKSAANSFEVRGKNLGIIGYGNIGSQLSVLAESLGLHVYYYDITEKLQLGNAKKCDSLHELLSISDIVSLHVDGRDTNTNLIGEKEFAIMKDKVIFMNLSRGHIVDIEALASNLIKGKVLGAAIDVFPYEPQSNQENFISKLQGLPNVILSPHIGGSTEEAQKNIGLFVARKLVNYLTLGDTIQSVNLPNIQLPEIKNVHRLIHLHSNVPRILSKINQVLANHDINIVGQYLKTNEDVGYVITDINITHNKELINELERIQGTIWARILY